MRTLSLFGLLLASCAMADDKPAKFSIKPGFTVSKAAPSVSFNVTRGELPEPEKQEATIPLDDIVLAPIKQEPAPDRRTCTCSPACPCPGKNGSGSCNCPDSARAYNQGSQPQSIVTTSTMMPSNSNSRNSRGLFKRSR